MRYRVIYAAYGLVLLVALAVNYIVVVGDPGIAGLQVASRLTGRFFQTYCWLQLVAISFTVPPLVGGIIAGDRESGNLELFLASPLNNWEIVHGKLAIRLLHVAFLILAGVPVMSCAALLGGIDPRRLAAVIAVSFATMVLLSSLTLVVSLWSPRVQPAILRSYLLTILLFGGPFPLAFFSFVGGLPSFVKPLLDHALPVWLALNPFAVICTMWNGWPLGSSDVLRMAWNLTWMHLAISAVLVAWATAMLRRVHRRTPSKFRKLGFSPNFSWRFRVWENYPLLWKECFAEKSLRKLGFVGRTVVVMIFASVWGFAAWLVFIQTTWRLSDVCFQLAILGSFTASIGLMWVAVRGAGSVTSEKQRATWLSLLSTPQTLTEITFAKILGNVLACRGFFIFMAAIWWLMPLREASFAALMAAVCSCGMLAILMLAASTLGVASSLYCRTGVNAVVCTVMSGLFFAFGYIFLLIPFMQGPASDGWTVLMSGFVPLLLVGPYVFAGEWMMSGKVVSNEMLAPILLGPVGYVFASVFLASLLTANFSRLTGRMERKITEEW